MNTEERVAYVRAAVTNLYPVLGLRDPDRKEVIRQSWLTAFESVSDEHAERIVKKLAGPHEPITSNAPAPVIQLGRLHPAEAMERNRRPFTRMTECDRLQSDAFRHVLFGRVAEGAEAAEQARRMLGDQEGEVFFAKWRAFHDKCEPITTTDAEREK